MSRRRTPHQRNEMLTILEIAAVIAIAAVAINAIFEVVDLWMDR